LLVQETNFTVWLGYLFLGNLFSIDLLNQKNKFVFFWSKFVFRIANRKTNRSFHPIGLVINSFGTLGTTQGAASSPATK